ncbi:E3 ubiquitin-protein ligase At1g12760-like isoform X2 [Musa acuminata AAA Group]|uniref:RING-type domain-containing protein n=1 Tax=Musa acuminata subsp. malaccensis TaxID=214687 RepID=A0A804K7L3_MUSAM|nr:PREDICTED: E3 ubiquitin-protein ligase At1g12760 isoform X2 [Musa acuminata subsp. malaccensis]
MEQEVKNDGHVIHMSWGNVASSSSSQDDEHDDSDGLHYDNRPSTRIRAPTFQSSMSMPASNSRNASLIRGGGSSVRPSHRSSLNSGFWISLELLLNVVQIIAAVTILSSSRHEHPQSPLFAWVIGYVIGCGATLPHLYWRFIHRNNHFSQHEVEHFHLGPSQVSLPESISYITMSPQALEEERSSFASILQYRQNSMIVGPRFNGFVDHFKMALDCFFAVWFVVGNVWIFSEHSSEYSAPNLYREDLRPTRGANSEVVNSLPTYKFRSKRRADIGNNQEYLFTFGILSSGSEERIISAEDSACCICLAKYVDNDELRELPCSHFFHKECIDKWLKINALCPLCKSEVGDTSSSLLAKISRHCSLRGLGSGINSARVAL